MSDIYTVEEMLQQIKSILPETAKIIGFTYATECFGNIFLRIKFNRKTHIFVVDRGQVFHNDCLLSDYAEKENIFSILLQTIRKELEI